MINVNRNQNAPASLETDEIREYLNSAVLHLSDKENNPKPDKPVTYRNSDLLTAFDRDFFSKCYLTEEKFANSWSLDIEHFLPQSERPDLVYSWENLFPANHYSNMIKPRITPQGGYLDPANPAHDVESEIIYTLSVNGENPVFTPANTASIQAVNTCNLLKRIHNGHNEDTTKGTLDLRHAIQKKHTEILNTIINWLLAVDIQDKTQYKEQLKEMISRKSSFTMLCRSMPAVRRLPADFFD